MPKLIRITTVPMALRYLLAGQMKFMSQNGFDVLMISADGKELNDVIENEKCRHVIVPMTRKITPLQDLRCLLRLIRLFKKEKPDIVHTHTPKAGILGMLAAKYCRIKVRIHTVAGLPMMVEHGWKYGLLRSVEKRTYKAATHVWPNSNSLLEFIVKERLVDPKKASVLGNGSTNGIDLNEFNRSTIDAMVLDRTRSLIKFEKDNTYLLFVGRLVKDKGLPELISVFASLENNFKNLRLILVGDFEPALDPLPEKTLNDIKNNPSIIHVGWSDDVKYFMSLANCFVFPSHREGFPNVLLQAAAMDLPIVCSRIAGNVDIVTHFQNGLIFERGNEEQMIEQLSFALDKPMAMKIFAEKLKSFVETNFRRENIWQNMLAAYKSLLN